TRAITIISTAGISSNSTRPAGSRSNSINSFFIVANIGAAKQNKKSGKYTAALLHYSYKTLLKCPILKRGISFHGLHFHYQAHAGLLNSKRHFVAISVFHLPVILIIGDLNHFLTLHIQAGHRPNQQTVVDGKVFNHFTAFPIGFLDRIRGLTVYLFLPEQLERKAIFFGMQVRLDIGLSLKHKNRLFVHLRFLALALGITLIAVQHDFLKYHTVHLHGHLILIRTLHS